jgi:hypothetical protein
MRRWCILPSKTSVLNNTVINILLTTSSLMIHGFLLGTFLLRIVLLSSLDTSKSNLGTSTEEVDGLAAGSLVLGALLADLFKRRRGRSQLELLDGVGQALRTGDVLDGALTGDDGLGGLILAGEAQVGLGSLQSGSLEDRDVDGLRLGLLDEDVCAVGIRV